MEDNWSELCLQLVPGLLDERDWRLVPQDMMPAFIRKVYQALAEGVVVPKPGTVPRETVRRATIHVYCRNELYPASGENGSLRQHRAFVEIARHAQGAAFRYEQNQEVVETCVQAGLQSVWEHREQMRDPGCFLRWVEKIVYHEIKGYWKKQQHQIEDPVSNIAPRGNDEELLQRFWETLASVPPPDDEVANRQMREQLWAEVQRVLAGNQRYQAVIIGYYLYELSYPVLAEMLQTPVRNLHVLKCRALARLRADEAFVGRFADGMEKLAGGES